MTRGTFYPMTLKGDVNPWNDTNVIVETIPELSRHEDQLKIVEGYIEEIKNTLLTKNFVYKIQEIISISICSCLRGYLTSIVCSILFRSLIPNITANDTCGEW